MKERPILFSSAMVRAILDGSKIQTRRVVKMKPHHQIEQRDDGSPWPWMYDSERDADWWMPCPHGQPGDQLWLREAYRFLAVHDHVPPREISGGPVWYEAQDEVPFHPSEFGKLRPGMFMPRWASRITLEVTAVRVERLQDISEADALAEGIVPRRIGTGDHRTGTRVCYGLACDEAPWATSAVQAYSYLWESINGPGSWDANPWVWVVEFRRIT